MYYILFYIYTHIYRYYSWSTYVEGTVKPSLHRLTGAASVATGAGAQEKGQQTTLTYYQATGIICI